MGKEVKGKAFYKSKTFWASAITAGLGWIPGAKELLVANPEIVTTGLGVVFTILRFVTKDKISVL